MKKIINGHGTIDKKTDKYIVHPKDRIESKKIIKKLFAEVKDILEAKFGKITVPDFDKKGNPEYVKSVEQASGYLFPPAVHIDSPNFRTGRKPFVYVKTGVCESGYTDKIVKRNFNISFELKGNVRYKNYKWTKDRFNDNGIIIKNFILADNYEDAIDEFTNWLSNEYDNFFTERMPQNLTYSQSR